MRLARGLATADAARIVPSVPNPSPPSTTWGGRSGVPVASLTELAQADVFLPSLRLERRDAPWAIKALLERPGSDKGVTFITIEDEHRVANVVVWPELVERSRRVGLRASIMGSTAGCSRRRGVQLVARRLFDLTADLSKLAERDGAFRLPTGCDDEFAKGSLGSPASREKAPAGVRARDMSVPDLRINTLKIKSQDFQ
jgi:error-prone DNA polymerase